MKRIVSLLLTFVMLFILCSTALADSCPILILSPADLTWSLSSSGTLKVEFPVYTSGYSLNGDDIYCSIYYYAVDSNGHKLFEGNSEEGRFYQPRSLEHISGSERKHTLSADISFDLRIESIYYTIKSYKMTDTKNLPRYYWFFSTAGSREAAKDYTVSNPSYYQWTIPGNIYAAYRNHSDLSSDNAGTYKMFCELFNLPYNPSVQYATNPSTPTYQTQKCNRCYGSGRCLCCAGGYVMSYQGQVPCYVCGGTTICMYCGGDGKR